jgi:hypothetical protein
MMSLKPEQITHINLYNWFVEKFPELEDDLHHFANERRCSVQEGRNLKRMGVKRGVSDFFLAFPVGEYAGLWLELKENNGKLSKEQIEFLNKKSSRGYMTASALGLEEGRMAFSHYLKGYKS